MNKDLKKAIKLLNEVYQLLDNNIDECDTVDLEQLSYDVERIIRDLNEA